MSDALSKDMLTLKTILVPIDFGESSAAAVRYAIALAQKLDAAILVMHAYEVPLYSYPAYPMLPMTDVETAMSSAAEKGLAIELARVKAEWPKASTLLRRGTPWREIIEAATTERADLIVMGTHGRQGLSHALMGSVAERVVRASPIPVMTIRGTESDAKRAAPPPAKASDDPADVLERRLSEPSTARIEAATVTGAIAGAATGALAGPVGAMAGGWVGSAIGATIAVVLNQEAESDRAATAQLDADVGVIGGAMGAADPNMPPARIGAFSAGSAGVAPASSATPSEGLMQDLSSDD